MTDNRITYDVPLRPVAGSRFQPTGFPDLGAATFEKPVSDGNGGTRWVDALLVESAQSMANRLEATAWNTADDRPHSVVEGLSYVEVRAEDGAYLTSSRTEAHRLASAFVRESTLDGQPMIAVIRDRLGLEDDRPLAPREIAQAVFDLDPFCLLHGVFFAASAKDWPGQPKIARAVTAFIEAMDVKPAHSGGVKKDQVRHSIAEGSKGAAEGYGTVPYHRTEWVASEIMAAFTIDTAQLAAYGLSEAATQLLRDLAHWEIRSALDGGLRLRTACDLEVAASDILDRAGRSLPSAAELEDRITSGIADVGHSEALVVTWGGGKK